jgi:hypothetical protein
MSELPIDLEREAIRWKSKIGEQIPLEHSDFFNFMVFLFLRHGAFTEETREDPKGHELDLKAQLDPIFIRHYFGRDEIIDGKAECFSASAKTAFDPDRNFGGTFNGDVSCYGNAQLVHLGEIRRVSGSHLFYLDSDEPERITIPLFCSTPVEVSESRILCNPTGIQFAELAMGFWEASQRFIRASGQIR